MTYSKEEYMLKYQKAKVRLLEHKVPKSKQPAFPLNYHDLSFPAVYYLSEYSDAIIHNDFERKNEYKEWLSMCAEFYDAALRAREREEYDIDFLLSGSVAYFYNDDFGSALVLIKEIKRLGVSIPSDMRGALADILLMIFLGKRELNVNINVSNAFEHYIITGDYSQLIDTARKVYFESLNGDNASDAFFAEAILAIIIIAQENSARKLLPLYSDLPYDKWKEYFHSSKSIKMMWPSQKLIGNKGILKGESAIIQLPTGVGKTKSIELVIRSMMLSGRGYTALIVAPLRALCSEITDEMRDVFSSETSVNQFSDLLEADYLSSFLDLTKKKILICTPEKLLFIYHHSKEVINSIDLFVFDEGHMFGDMNRGALYELLITTLKSKVLPDKQLLVMSAVLSNSQIVTNWLLGNRGVLAYDERIKSTPKVTGFVSSEEMIHYYSDSIEEEDFFIPNAYKKSKLKSNAKVPKYFPDGSPKDMALYFANQLCENGGIAIYMSQIRSISPLLKRAVDINKKGSFLMNISSVSDKTELKRLANFIGEYYGKASEYYKAAEIGIFPHYSRLPNGLRSSIEYAYKRGLINVVVCTSTLAQGVNIPIKYLIMTSINSSYNKMSANDYANLIGRTARAGVYTEGSVIIADPHVYDNKLEWAGHFKWDEAVQLFNNSDSSSCGSAILSLVKDLEINYNTKFRGESICKFIIKNIDNWSDQLTERLLVALKNNERNDSRISSCVQDKLNSYKTIISSIENNICTILSSESKDNYSESELVLLADSLCKDTLAYHLASPAEGEWLLELFSSIGKYIYRNLQYYKKSSKSLVDIETTKKIISFIEKARLYSETFECSQLLLMVLDLYNILYPDKQLTFEECRLWISGNTFIRISEETQKSVRDIEKICEKHVSYQLCFLLGNLLDYLEESCPNYENIAFLQKQIKYGVNTRTAISICERIINERIVANKIALILANDSLGDEQIISCVKVKESDIKALLKEYPSYFINKIDSL